MSIKAPLVIAADAWAADQWGGAYKIATELAVFCAAGGREVHYVCSDVKNLGGTLVDQGVTVWRYPRPRRRGATAIEAFFSHMTGARASLRHVSSRLNRPFVFNGHGHLPYLAGIYRSSAPIFRRVMSVHSPLADEYLANRGGSVGLRDGLVHWCFRQIEKACYRRSDMVQCYSRFTASLLRRSFEADLPDDVLICPGYVDYERMSVALSRQEARQRLGTPCWSTDDICFFSLRRHAKRMGLENLISAISWMKAADSTNLPKYRLILGGEGPDTPKLKELVASLGLAQDVHFLGSIEEDEKTLHYRAADCFVLPTTALEGFGLIVLESFAAGTPVIATPVGAIPELLGEFGAECLTEGIEPEAIGRRMISFLTDHPRSDPRVEDRKRYARQFDKSTVLARLESLVMGGAP